MIDSLKKEATARMVKSVDSLKQELTKLRTGRAHASLLDHITVSYYGNDTPLNQVASVAVADARTLLVTPWEKNMVGPIEKAILKSDLGLNPASAGTTRVPAIVSSSRAPDTRRVRTSFAIRRGTHGAMHRRCGAAGARRLS